MTTERKLYQRLKTLVPDAHWVRVETSSESGVPDANYCANGAETWVELKTKRIPARVDTRIRVKLRPEQAAWARRRASAGGRVMVALGLHYGPEDYRRRGFAAVLMFSARRVAEFENGFTIGEVRRWGQCLQDKRREEHR